MTLCLGKKPAVKDERDLLFADFKKPTAEGAYPVAPVGFGEKHAALLTPHLLMMGNGPAMPGDDIPPTWIAAQQGAGDCVWADAGNRARYSNLLAGKQVTVTGEECIEMYQTETGYDPITGANDNGTDMRDALNYARTTGILDHNGSRHLIGGYCALGTTGDALWTELLEALAVFDVVSIGLQFRQCYMDQFNAGQPWNYQADSPIVGGHDVLVATRRLANQIQVFTWATLHDVYADVVVKDVDEAYGIFLPDSMVAGKGPEGFDMAEYQAALAAL